MTRTSSDRDESGVETATLILVLPILMILFLGMIDVAWKLRAQFLVQTQVRDGARKVAVLGGNSNPRTAPGQPSVERQVLDRLYPQGRCAYSTCQSGRRPTVDCYVVYAVDIGAANPPRHENARAAGDTAICVASYPYRALNPSLFSGPQGLGIGLLLKPFTVRSEQRAETGVL